MLHYQLYRCVHCTCLILVVASSVLPNNCCQICDVIAYVPCMLLFLQRPMLKLRLLAMPQLSASRWRKQMPAMQRHAFQARVPINEAANDMACHGQHDP